MGWGSRAPSKPGKAMVCLEGKTEYLDPGTSFSKVPELADKHGIGKFRLWLNNKEIQPSEAPATVKAGDQIEIKREDNVA